jgi:hypothetical protein
MRTARPKRLTARLARVLSLASSLTKDPMRMTAITTNADRGILNFSGIMAAKRTPVLFQIRCMGFVTIVIGTWKKNRRREMASQRRKGTTQPKSFLWRMRPAIHQLLPASACHRAVSNIGIMKERPSAGKTMCENELRDSKSSRRGGKPITGRICKYTANSRRTYPVKRRKMKMWKKMREYT